MITKELFRNAKRTISKIKMLEVLETQVFSDQDFIRHIRETASKENIPEDVVETIIKHHIKTCSLEMIKKKKIHRRIVLFGFIHIDIVEPNYNEFSIYNNKKIEKK